MIARWIAARQVKVRTGFTVTFYFGVLYMIAAVTLPALGAEDFLIGLIVAMVGLMGFDSIEWIDR